MLADETCDNPACTGYRQPDTREHEHDFLLFAHPGALSSAHGVHAHDGDGDRALPSFGNCAAYQNWWNEVGRKGLTHLYHLEKWHPMARKCWPPNTYMMRITGSGERVDLIATHDDLLDIYQQLKANKGSDPGYALTLRFFYHLCAVTTDPLHLLKQKAQIAADMEALDNADYARIVGAMGKYSSRYDTYVHYIEIQDQIEAHFGKQISALKRVLERLRKVLGG